MLHSLHIILSASKGDVGLAKLGSALITCLDLRLVHMWLVRCASPNMAMASYYILDCKAVSTLSTALSN